MTHAVPKVVDGHALEDGEEEEQSSQYVYVECHGGVENADMDATDCDAE